MIYRIFVSATLAIAAFAFAPSGAVAANFCVGSVPACTGSPLPPFTTDAAGISGAITAANGASGSDNIFLAPGTYTLGAPLNPTFAALQDIHIIGAGVGQTVFTGSIASTEMLTLNFATVGSEAKGFSLNVTGTPSGATGLRVLKGTISEFAVNQPDGAASNFRAIELDSGATATRGAVALTSSGGVGLEFTDSAGADDGIGHASELTLTGGGSGGFIAIAINTGTSTPHSFDRLRISGFFRGIEIDDGGFFLTNTLIDMGDKNGALGIDAFNGTSSSSISANASRVTIVGRGPNQTALSIGAGAIATQIFSGGFSDLVLFAAGESSTGLVCVGGGVSVATTINSYAIRGADTDFSGCSPLRLNKTDLTALDPGFRDFNGGDYRLRPTSPLVDSGFAGEIISPDERDLTGAARVVDGDANGVATVDLGAFEYQRTAPTVSASASPQPCQSREVCGFTATGADADGEVLTFAWTFDDGATATGASASHAFATAGAHTATVTATDEAGLTASSTVVVSAAPLPSAKVTAKPKKSFAQKKKGFAAPQKKQPFFTISFADSAKAKFTLQSKSKGKLKTVKGSQTLAVKTGANKFAFGGKFGGKKLKPGKYRVTVTPLRASGFPGKPVTVDFKLL